MQKKVVSGATSFEIQFERRQLSLDELLKRIIRQEYRVPEFQREFVWKNPRIGGYLQSLYQGVPTGSILMWKPSPSQGISGTRVLGDRQSDEQPVYIPLILDGQQRLTSLYLATQGVSGRVRAYFNLKDGTFGVFKSSQPKLDKDPDWVRVEEIFTKTPAELAEDLVRQRAGKEENFAKDLEAQSKVRVEFTNKLNDVRNRIGRYTYNIEEISNIGTTP